MANTLPNKITKDQAEAAASVTYEKFTELAGVYDLIASQSNGGAFSVVYSVVSGEVERVNFIAAELITDGYGVTVSAADIEITWGVPPAS